MAVLSFQKPFVHTWARIRSGSIIFASYFYENFLSHYSIPPSFESYFHTLCETDKKIYQEIILLPPPTKNPSLIGGVYVIDDEQPSMPPSINDYENSQHQFYTISYNAPYIL